MVNRFVVGTAQNTSGDKAPLSYATGTTLTDNQSLTIRLNSLFIAAAVDDADGDGLPTACDANPAVANVADNVCPNEVGSPTGASLAGTQNSGSTAVPIGELACKPGYVAVGLAGGAGALIDRIQVHCRAVSFFATGSTASDYWTDPYGGPGGVPWDTECASGSVLSGIQADTTDVAPATLVGLLAECTPYSSIVAGQYNPTNLTWEGGNAVQFSVNECSAGQSLVGFQARSYDARWVTGLQPICSSFAANFAPYIGGFGGVNYDQQCPVGYVGTSLLYNTDPSNTSIAFMGMLCALKSSVQEGGAIPGSALWVVHGQAHSFDDGLDVAPLVEPFSPVGEQHLPGYSRSDCPDGFALTGVSGAQSTANVWSGDVAALTSFTCQQVAPPNLTWTFQLTGVGSTSGATTQSSNCPAGEYFDGLYVQTGWLTDGIAPHCQ